MSTNYKQLYDDLFADVVNLGRDFRDLKLSASDREAPAYEDAADMTLDVLQKAEWREL